MKTIRCDFTGSTLNISEAISAEHAAFSPFVLQTLVLCFYLVF